MVQLVPEPLPALSTGSQDQELDVTLEEMATTGTENTQHDAEQEAGSTKQGTSAQGEERHQIHTEHSFLSIVATFVKKNASWCLHKIKTQILVYCNILYKL